MNQIGGRSDACRLFRKSPVENPDLVHIYVIDKYVALFVSFQVGSVAQLVAGPVIAALESSFSSESVEALPCGHIAVD